MDIEVVRKQAVLIKKDIEDLLKTEGLEPCVVNNLEAAQAHIELLCMELSLDLDDPLFRV